MTEQERIDLAAQCPDLAYFRPVEGAGFVLEKNGLRVQKTHFGGHVLADGNYGAWMTDLIKKLSGIHEPQEEKFSVKSCRMSGRLACWSSGVLGILFDFVEAGPPAADQMVLETTDERRLVGETNVAPNKFEASFICGANGDGPGAWRCSKTNPQTLAV